MPTPKPRGNEEKSGETPVRFPIRFPILAGATASGKTALGVEVALALRERGLDAEIVTADAFQIFRGMDIGTAKPTAEEQRGIRHHLIDVVEPNEAFTVAHWLAAANEAIAAIRSRGCVPIVVGGTHLYVKSLLDGMFEGPGADEKLRGELRAMSMGELRAELERVDPIAAARIHPNDERRTVRALEVYRLTGTPISAHQRQWDAGEAGQGDDRVLVAIEWATETLNTRINARVKEMVARGLVDEVRGLWEAGKFGSQSREAVGYKQLIEHFERGNAKHPTLEEAIEQVKIKTRHVGKAQRTWIRRLRTTPNARFIDAQTLPPAEWTRIVLEAMGIEGDSARPDSGSIVAG